MRLEKHILAHRVLLLSTVLLTVGYVIYRFFDVLQAESILHVNPGVHFHRYYQHEDQDD